MTSKNSRKREISIEFQNDNFSRLFVIFSSVPASMHTPSPFYILFPLFNFQLLTKWRIIRIKTRKPYNNSRSVWLSWLLIGSASIRFKLELHFESDTKFARFGDIGLNSGYTVSVFFRWYTFVKQILRIAKNLHMIVRFI